MNPLCPMPNGRAHPAAGSPSGDPPAVCAGRGADGDGAVHNDAVTRESQDPISPAPALSGARGRAGGALDRAVPVERLSPWETVHVVPDEWITDGPNGLRLWISITLYLELCKLRKLICQMT